MWPRACYWLYDAATCRPILENGTPVTGQTDAEGKFRLKPGQSAIFYSFYEAVFQNGGDGTEGQADSGQEQNLRQLGIASGTVYGVTEEPATGFRQYTPGTLDYYTGLEVDDSVKPCAFVNEVKDPGGLSVTKQVVNTKGEALLDEDDVYFKFVLMKKQAGVGETSGTAVNPADYAPAANVLYSVTVGGAIIRSGRTDENGCFILKANETADFDKILRGDFYVQEVESALAPGYWFDHVEWSGSSENQTGAQSRMGTAGLTISGGNDNAGGRLAGAVLTAASDTQYGTDMTAISANGSSAKVSGLSGNDSDYVEDSDGSNPTVVIPGVSKGNRWDENNPLPFTLTTDGMDITYYNKYTPDRTDLTLVKMNNETNGKGLNADGTPGETYTGEGEHLANAEFDLYRVERQNVPEGTGSATGESSTETLVGSYVTDTNGVLSIPDLASGLYRLKETKAPDGYMPMDTMEIEVERLTQSRAEGEKQIAAGTVVVKINETPVLADSTPGGKDNNRKDSNRKPCVAGLVSNALADAGSPGYANDDQLTVWAYDDFLYALPHSGGSGIYWYLIGGVLLMMAASLILYKDKLKYAGRLR